MADLKDSAEIIASKAADFWADKDIKDLRDADIASQVAAASPNVDLVEKVIDFCFPEREIISIQHAEIALTISLLIDDQLLRDKALSFFAENTGNLMVHPSNNADDNLTDEFLKSAITDQQHLFTAEELVEHYGADELLALCGPDSRGREIGLYSPIDRQHAKRKAVELSGLKITDWTQAFTTVLVAYQANHKKLASEVASYGVKAPLEKAGESLFAARVAGILKKMRPQHPAPPSGSTPKLVQRNANSLPVPPPVITNMLPPVKLQRGF